MTDDPPFSGVVGFTGTQQGMTSQQIVVVSAILTTVSATRYSLPIEFHSGDCIGADSEAHFEATRLGFRTVLHPPSDAKKRAYNVGDEVLPPLIYRERNYAIVNASDLVIATPKGFIEEGRGSGTWMTIRYAASRANTLIVWPNGAITQKRRVA